MAVREIIQDGAGMLPDVLTGMTQTELEDTLRAILRVLNGGISHGSGLDGHQSGNFSAQTVKVTSPAVANQEFTVVHGLGRRPVGYNVMDRNLAGGLYSDSRDSWTESLITLKCSLASVTFWLEIY